MKKLVILLTVVAAYATASAQEITSKKGEVYLPEEGDWAVGIDAAPFLEYIGNMFNRDANTSPRFNYTDGGTRIYGKWFKSADMAWRGKLRLLGINNSRDVRYVINDLSTDPNILVEDARIQSQMEIGLGFGIEKRRGKTRLQGFYGAEVNITYGSAGEKYEYGNDMTVTNFTPTTSDFGENYLGPSSRVTEIDRGSYYFFGVRPFIGAEYFILPKISLGGEFGINIGFGGGQPDEITVEYYDAVTASVRSAAFRQDENNVTNLVVDNDNLSGALKILFHF